MKGIGDMSKLQSYLEGFIIGTVGVIAGGLLLGTLPENLLQVGQVVFWAGSIGFVVIMCDRYKMPFVWVLLALVMFGVGVLPFFLGSLWVKNMPKQADVLTKFTWRSIPKGLLFLVVGLLLSASLWIPLPLTNSMQKIYSITVIRAYPAVALMYADKSDSIAEAKTRYEQDIAKIRAVTTEASIFERMFGIRSSSQKYKEDVLKVYEEFGKSEHWSNWEQITTLSSERKTKWEAWSEKNQELAKQYTITPSYTKLVTEIDQLAREIEEIDNKMNTLKSEADKLYDEFITQLGAVGA